MKALFKKSLFFGVFLVLNSASIYCQTQWTQTTTPPSGTIWSIESIGNNLFAGASNGGIYFSNDDGVTWVQRNGNFPNMEVYALAVSGTDLYAGTGGLFGAGILKSSDNGLSWTDLTPPGMSNGIVRALVVNSGFIFAGIFGGSEGVFKSPLAGISTSTWSSFSAGLVNDQIRSLEIKNNTIYAGTHGDGVWQSPITNANWSQSSNTMTSNADYVQALHFNGTTFYAGNISGSPVLYQSSNNGVTWTASNNGTFASFPVYALESSGNTTFVGTEYSGVYKTTDNGQTWTDYNLGFQDNSGAWFCNDMNVRSFHFLGSTIYAGTDCGVWKRTNHATNLAVDELSNPSLFQIYPNPTTDQLTIKRSDFAQSKNYSLQMTNALGQIVFASSFLPETLSLSNIQVPCSGIYFVTFLDGDGNSVQTTKVVVK